MSRVSDELQALSSIYGENVSFTFGENQFGHCVKYTESNCYLKLQLPHTYPESSPHFEFFFQVGFECSQNFRTELFQDTERVLVENIGFEVLFQIIELFRSKISQELDIKKNNNLSINNVNISKELILTIEAKHHIIPHIVIIHGKILTERKSTFQAHMTKVNSTEDVNNFKKILLEDKKVHHAINLF